MIGISVSLPVEAKPIVEHFQLKLTQRKPFSLWENETIALVETGVGFLRCASGTTFLAAVRPVHALLNIGIAGHRSAEPGTLFWADRVKDAFSNRSEYPSIPFKAPILRSNLLTLPYPSDDYLEGWLYDMEAYGFVTAAARFVSYDDLFVLKIVSDNLKANTEKITPDLVRTLMCKNLPNIEEFIAKIPAKTDAANPLFPHVHMTFTQKKQLEDLLNCLTALHAEIPPEAKECKSAKELLRILSKHIEVNYDRYPLH